MKCYHMIFVFILWVVTYTEVEGACKAHDAAWNRGVKPRITQPARGEPDKVVLDWSQAIYNARCVDFYNVYVWKHGQPRERGQKIVVMDKTKSKMDLVIEPCVNYDFAVEFVERDWTHTDQKISETAKFKTETIPELLDQDKRNFVVKYFKDPTKGHDVVDKVSIKFRKSIIKHASCIKEIDIEGRVDKTPAKPRQKFNQAEARAAFFNQRTTTQGSRYSGSSSHIGGSSYSGGSSTTGGFQGHGQVGGSSQTGGSNSGVGGSSSYNPGGWGQVGGSSSSGGFGQVGGSSQTGGYNQVGGSSSYNPVGGSSSSGGGWNYGHNSIYPDNYGYTQNYNCPVGGSSQSTGYVDPRCYYSNRPDYSHNHDHQANARPPYNNNNNNGLNWGNNNGWNSNNLDWSQQRRNKRATSRPNHGGNNVVKHKLTPPFYDEFIEAVINVKPCQAYMFTLNIVTPRGSSLGKITDLRLPWLSEMHDFHPPDLSKLFQFSPTGTVTLKQSSGIPNTCMKDLFTAVDNHIHHLEQDVQFHINKEHAAHRNTFMFSQQLDNHKSQQLSADGCLCNSTYISINGTSKSSYSNLMGTYHYEAMFKGKPYFRQQLNTQVQGQAANTQTGYLYWEPTTNMWNLGPTLGGTDQKFRTKTFSNAKCPADLGNLKNWQYSGTLKWKNEPSFKVECLRH